MGWLPCGPDDCTASCGTSALQAGRGKGAGECALGGWLSAGEEGRVLPGSSVGSDHPLGRLRRPLCTPEYIVTLWCLCHS